MQYEYILMVIPIIIVVAFLVVIAKRMTDGERPDISGAVLGTIIIAVGLLIMVPIISSVDPQYAYDDEDKTFTLYKNVTGTEFSWGSAANAESLIIEDTVTTISAGAFASFTNLRYVSIPDSLETIGENALPTLKDYLDQTITEPEAGEYVGTGDGMLYFCDDSIFAYNSSNAITGLTSEAASAVHLVIPENHGGSAITAIASAAFRDNTTITTLLHVPGSELETVSYNAFRGCTSLAVAELPDTVSVMRNNLFRETALETFVVPPLVRTIEDFTFSGCASLADIDLANVETIGQNAFGGCTSLTSFEFPDTVTSYGGSLLSTCTGLTTVTLSSGANALPNYMFNGCTSLSSIVIPDNVTTIGSGCFQGCIGITSVSFGTGLSEYGSNSPFPAWTFYDSDGTTQIDKTVPANLAGYTFQGTASALVKVLPDRSALTPEQTLKVQELTKAAKALKLEYPELADA